jgi:hypothetical protein
MPECVTDLRCKFPPVVISEHAQRKAQQRHISIRQDEITYIDGRDIVEAEFDCGVLTKIVVRKPYGHGDDICYVLRYDMATSRVTLITVWLNNSHDNHNTLDESVYEKE